MSVLWFDGLLAQSAEAGVYFLPDADVDELLEAAAVNTFPCVRVNLRGCEARADLMAVSSITSKTFTTRAVKSFRFTPEGAGVSALKAV